MHVPSEEMGDGRVACSQKKSLGEGGWSAASSLGPAGPVAFEWLHSAPLSLRLAEALASAAAASFFASLSVPCPFTLRLDALGSASARLWF